MGDMSFEAKFTRALKKAAHLNSAFSSYSADRCTSYFSINHKGGKYHCAMTAYLAFRINTEINSLVLTSGGYDYTKLTGGTAVVSCRSPIAKFINTVSHFDCRVSNTASFSSSRVYNNHYPNLWLKYMSEESLEECRDFLIRKLLNETNRAPRKLNVS